MAEPSLKPTVLITGAAGLIGSLCTTMLENQGYTCLAPSSQQLDITNSSSVAQFFADKRAQAVIHLAAYTNVSQAYAQTGDTTGPAFRINVEGTKHIAQACSDQGIHLVHISTAYVFNGEKKEMYVEDDTRSPIEWYGQTKALAEEHVEQLSSPWTILRIDAPFRSDSFAKADVAHQIISGLRANNLFPQFTDHFFGPTCIEDFCKVIEWAIRTKTTGHLHASAGEQWTNYDFAMLINQQFGFGRQIEASTLAAYLAKNGNRPYQRNTALDTTKMQSLLDFKTSTIKEAISKIQVAQAQLES